MALRIREDGTILCAAMHPAEAGDTYLHDGIHDKLSACLGAIVTDSRHSQHGQWWWRDEMEDEQREDN